MGFKAYNNNPKLSCHDTSYCRLIYRTLHHPTNTKLKLDGSHKIKADSEVARPVIGPAYCTYQIDSILATYFFLINSISDYSRHKAKLVFSTLAMHTLSFDYLNFN